MEQSNRPFKITVAHTTRSVAHTLTQEPSWLSLASERPCEGGEEPAHLRPLEEEQEAAEYTLQKVKPLGEAHQTHLVRQPAETRAHRFSTGSPVVVVDMATMWVPCFYNSHGGV